MTILKRYLPISILILSITTVFSFLLSVNGAEDNVIDLVNQEKIKIAVCPTFLNLAESLNEDGFVIIKTQSTSESLDLLKRNIVDYVLAGRPPKPNEKNYQTEYISKTGYSFIGRVEKAVDRDKLEKEIICTDLEKNQVETNLHLNEVIQVDSFIKCPQEAIIVTSWDNTVYEEFWPAHVINSDGSRHILSRTPIVYCNETCPLNIINQIKIAYEK